MINEMPPWVLAAERYLGQHEIAGAQDNSFIVECLRRCGLPADMLHDQTAWCAAFVNRCFDDCGLRGTHSAAAISFALHPELFAPLPTFRPGCVAVFDRDGGHHVAFALAELSKNVVILGGNQSNRVGIDPRSKSLLRTPGYFWPTGVP